MLLLQMQSCKTYKPFLKYFEVYKLLIQPMCSVYSFCLVTEVYIWQIANQKINKKVIWYHVWKPFVMRGTTQLTLSISQIPESARKVLSRQEGRGNLSQHFYINSTLPKISAPLYYSASYAWPIGVKTLLQAEVISLFKTSAPSLPNLSLAIRLRNLSILTYTNFSITNLQRLGWQSLPSLTTLNNAACFEWTNSVNTYSAGELFIIRVSATGPR